MSIKFTVGFAVSDQGPPHPESIRATFTAMSLLIHHPLVGEVVAVMNSDKTGPLADFANKTGGRMRFVHMPSPKGTSAPRNRVFAEAKFDHVACIDSHVLLHPGFFESLAEWYDHPEVARDLMHGPMTTEAGNVMATHMNDQWRSEMWGTWGRAWESPNGHLFSALTTDDKTLTYVTIGGEQQTITRDEVSLMGVPYPLDWPGHEAVLKRHGCREFLDHPFEVPGHGMGFFACRKDAWIPFHPDARGFGGEEMTTGVRFRRAGRKCWCVPGAKWWHHFDRYGYAPPYRLTLWDKVRNYVIEFQRLGLNLTPIREHFGRDKLNDREWEQVVAGINWPRPNDQTDPATIKSRPDDMPPDTPEHKDREFWKGAFPGQTFRTVPQPGQPYQPQSLGNTFSVASLSFDGGGIAVAEVPTHADVRNARRYLPPPSSGMVSVERKAKTGGCAATGKTADEVQSAALEQIFQYARSQSSDIRADVDALRNIALQCETVTEFTRPNAVSTIALLAGRPKLLRSYYESPSEMASQLGHIVPDGCAFQYGVGKATDDLGESDEIDLLLLDSGERDGQTVLAELDKLIPRCRRYVVLTRTKEHGERSGNKPGLLPAVRGFLQSHAEWKPVAHHQEGSGLLVLQKNPPAGTQFIDMPGPAMIKPPTEGPGTELKAILASLGIEPDKAGCDCNGKAQQMNMWGDDGTEANVNTVIGWMRDGMGRWGWADKLTAAALAVKTGLALKIDPFDPFPGIVREAIRRSREKKQVK